MSTSDEGVRLAKLVAAMQGCSRREAEALIEAGAVRVDGERVCEPARRVRVAVAAPQRVQIDPLAPALATPATLLLHKAAGVSAAQALATAWGTLGGQRPGQHLPSRPWPKLQLCLPLPDQASGLAIWSDERAVLRCLLDRQRPLEIEWRLTLSPTAPQAAIVSGLRRGGMRVSLSHEREGVAQWRLCDKADRGAALVDWLQEQTRAQAPSWQLHRQRIGRLALSPLLQGQARWRQDAERF